MNVAFSLTSGSVFTRPRQFGPTMRMPCSRAIESSSVSTFAPGASGFGESGGDDRHGAHAALRRLFKDFRYVLGGHRDNGQIDSLGHRGEVRKGRDTADRTGLRVHGIDRARTSPARSDRTTSWPGLPRRRPAPDNGDHPRPQDRSHARRLGDRFSFFARGAVLGRRAKIDVKVTTSPSAIELIRRPSARKTPSISRLPDITSAKKALYSL